VQGLPWTEHLGTEPLEARGLLRGSALLETEEVCTLIEGAVESPRSTAATLAGGPGSPAPSSLATATGAPPASALAAAAPAAAAAAGAAAEAAASPEPDVHCHCVHCHCGLRCVVYTAGRRVRRTFYRCPRHRSEGGCMFFRRCDRAASYDGPGCKRPDCACTASYNGKPDEYCCATCRLGLGLDPNPNPNT
jgi:hypothetical protein